MLATARGTIIAAPRKHHGLGNRVRAVLGARALARGVDRSFRYSWPVHRRFGARLDQLWEIDDPTVAPWVSRALATAYPYRDESLQWMDGAARSRIWQIRTAHALHLPAGVGSWEDELRALRPVAPVREAVTAFHERELMGVPYVGVMVRAHQVSHEETLRESPVEWYVARMHQIRAQRPDLRFFVSADTSAAQQTVVDSVPGSVALSDKGDYNTLAGLRSAVTDLYLLAGATHLLGPHLSSFPELAQKLAGPDLKLETSRSDTTTAFDASAASFLVRDPILPHRRTSALG